MSFAPALQSARIPAPHRRIAPGSGCRHSGSLVQGRDRWR